MSCKPNSCIVHCQCRERKPFQPIPVLAANDTAKGHWRITHCPSSPLTPHRRCSLPSAISAGGAVQQLSDHEQLHKASMTSHNRKTTITPISMLIVTHQFIRLHSCWHTCRMLSSATEAMTQSSDGFHAKSEILLVWPPWMNSSSGGPSSASSLVCSHDDQSSCTVTPQAGRCTIRNGYLRLCSGCWCHV